MHILIGKKQILLAALVVMLGLAVFVNWYVSRDGRPLSPEGTSPAGEQADGAAVFTGAGSADAYFADMRLKRGATQSAALEELEAVAASADADTEQGRAAAAAVALFTDRLQKQTDIESLVSAGIGSECVAILSDTGVDVILRPEALNEQNVLTVSDVIRSVVGADCENVRVSSPVNVNAVDSVAKEESADASVSADPSAPASEADPAQAAAEADVSSAG